MNIKYLCLTNMLEEKRKTLSCTSLLAREVWDVLAFTDGACFACVNCLFMSFDSY